jgi:hypothetical protein
MKVPAFLKSILKNVSFVVPFVGIWRSNLVAPFSGTFCCCLRDVTKTTLRSISLESIAPNATNYARFGWDLRMNIVLAAGTLNVMCATYVR